MKKLILLFVVFGLAAAFSSCRKGSEEMEPPQPPQPPEEEIPIPLEGTHWVGKYYLYLSPDEYEKRPIEHFRYELIFTSSDTVTYIVTDKRGSFINEGSYTYDPPKVTIDATGVDHMPGVVVDGTLIIGIFQTFDIVYSVEFAQQQ